MGLLREESVDDRSTGGAGLRPDPAHGRGWYSRRYLPHFDSPGNLQMLTLRLADALPSLVLAEPALGSANAAERRARVEAFLDAGHGACFLRDPRIASVVQETLLYFDEGRYRLLAWVIMPNHVHALIETLPGYSLSALLQAWKSFTAKEANKLLGRSGRFWQADYFDRAIRDERHLASAVAYIHANPVKAGLVTRPDEWRFSSAALA